jgi:uncharacterized protein YaiE (UPF0345 family)
MPLVDELLDPPFLPQLLPESAPDPAYPVSTPPDPTYPGQTRDPLGAPLDEIATPSMWSRLSHPLEHTLVEVWETLGLFDRARPVSWVAIHYGRIALNAHAWERMRARIAGDAPDENLVEPVQGAIAGLSERFEALRARWRVGRLDRRLERASERRERALERLSSLDPGDLDAGELARGPLDDNTWVEILMPWLGERLYGMDEPESDACLRAAVGVEQRCNAELGVRLAARRTLATPAQVAYLTVEERLRAVLDGSSEWAELAAIRQERVEAFTKFDIPRVFWGRPRPDAEKA